MKSKKATVLNKFGISVVKCCASCQHKELHDERMRPCKLGDVKVMPDYLCPRWIMRESLDNAGMGGGRVRKRHWLNFVLDKTGFTEYDRHDY